MVRTVAGIGLGLVGLVVGGAFLWAATMGAEGLGLAGGRPGRRRGLLAAGAVLVLVGLLLGVGGLVELAR
jgi:hypothetical protein